MGSEQFYLPGTQKSKQVDLSFSWACKLAREIRQIPMIRAQ